MPRLKISDKQRDFLSSKFKGTIFRGGIGSGKTRIVCYKAIENALRGRRELIVSFSFPMLRDVVLHTMMESLPLFELRENVDYRINKTEMTITIHGTQILLRSGDDPDNIRGLNVDDFFIDEARNFKDDAIFLICLGRIRESEDAQWYISSSPRGKDWVYELALSDPENITLIVQKTTENPFLPNSYVEELRKRYTSKFAAQEIDADIVELSAGVINPEWFNIIDSLEVNNGVRFWDTAVTIKQSSDYSAGALCSVSNGRFRIHNIIRDKFEYPDLKKKIITVGESDGNEIIIGMEAVGQSIGFVDDIKRSPELRMHTIKASTPSGDKLNRALPWVTRAESGLVDLCRGSWNKNFLNECSDFAPDMSHQHDDMVDSVSGAYALLNESFTRAYHVKLY